MEAHAVPDSSDEEVMADSATDNTENRFAVDLVFIKLLLPALRAYVIGKMEAFFDEHPKLKKPRGYSGFKTDPVKKNVDLFLPVVMYANDDTMPNFHEFAKLYFEKPYFENLTKCGDVRVFLVLVTKAGCFTQAQANLAYKLKNQRDVLAHREIISDKMRKDVFDNVENLLQAIPNTTDCLKDLELARDSGVRGFLPVPIQPTPKFQRKSMKKQRKATKATEGTLQLSWPIFIADKEKRQFFYSAHLLTAFSINLICLMLSIANIVTCNVAPLPQIVNHELESLNMAEKEELNTTKEENKRMDTTTKKCEQKMAMDDKASNTWISTITTKRRLSQDSKRPAIVIKEEGNRSPRKTTNSSAAQVGYYFNCWDPTPDPRFHPDSQLMIGPIPSRNRLPRQHCNH
jgi:hypothetical protein